MIVLPALFLLGSLFLRGGVEAEPTAGDTLREDALQWKGPATCATWDCNCTFTRQRGCCCAATDMYELEDETYERTHALLLRIFTLCDRVKALEGNRRIAFKATMGPNAGVQIPGSNLHCFGPFNTNVPIPYSVVTLNDHNAYNPSLGVFTAPISGTYVFSFTVYSFVGVGGRLYHKVRLMKNGIAIVATWEDNREDGEDSATVMVLLVMKKGDQVYMELVSGRKLCKHLQYNIFTGYILHPSD